MMQGIENVPGSLHFLGIDWMSAETLLLRLTLSLPLSFLLLVH